MTKCKQKLSWIIILLFCQYVACNNITKESNEDLTGAEAKDGQLEIIKTIKKINDDGSYTIGYEADDGSFKIESRDVLGNIKGTYGYVDEDGEIKRVSYTANNASDALTDAPTVVQRIPKSNKTYSTTRKPGILLYSPTTQSTPTSTSVIQPIPKKRTTVPTISTTTNKSEKANYSRDVSRSSTGRPSNIVYATPVPNRNTVYTQRPHVRSTSVTQSEALKSEGQIIRPEIITTRTTELPVFRKVSFKNPLLDDESLTIKPVAEEQEVRGNLLRRQLSEEKLPPFDARQHVLTLQQGLGEDTVDVYSASLTTGTPRPLFTTTNRPINPTAQVVVEKPALRYVSNLHAPIVKQPSTTELVQQASTTEAAVTEASTPTSVPVYQIPPAEQESLQQPLVALRHPFHRGVVLVPYNQIRNQEVNHPQYVVANGPYFREVRPTPIPIPQHVQTPAPVFIQRPPTLRSLPVAIDENGYVRPLPRNIQSPTPQPVPIPITPQLIPKHLNGDIDNEIDNIKPPVSTKEFQMLIELLLIRQARLERANALINAQRQRELFHLQRRRPIVQHQLPILVRPTQDDNPNGPVTFVHQVQSPKNRGYITIPQTQVPQEQQQEYLIRPPTQDQQQEYIHRGQIAYVPSPASYIPTKRVSRLLHNNPPNEQEIENENYLPPEVREMLLLRMLQLAINPSLPLDEDEQESMASEHNVKKAGVRNVEVLGEEEGEEEDKLPVRNKRYRGNNRRYYE